MIAWIKELLIGLLDVVATMLIDKITLIDVTFSSKV